MTQTPSATRSVLLLAVFALAAFGLGLWLLGEDTARRLELEQSAAADLEDSQPLTAVRSDEGVAAGDRAGSRTVRATDETWAVRGFVQYPDGAPAGAVRLRVTMHAGYEVSRSPVSTRTVESRDDGSFACALEDPARTVRFEIASEDSAVRMTTARPLVLRGQQPPQDLRLTVYPLDAQLQLVVVDERDAPIAGAWVVRGNKKQVGTTDRDGVLRFAVSSRAKRIGLQIGAKGYMMTKTSVGVPESGATAHARVCCKRGLTIRGVVQDESGRPIVGARVQNFYSIFFRAAETDARGRFELSWLNPARSGYSVFARKDGYLEGRVAVERASVDAEHVLVLKRGVAVRGRVLGDGDKPVPGARLYIGFSPSAYDRIDALSDDDGRFTFSVVAPGSRRLSCEAAGFAPNVSTIEVSPDTPVHVVDVRMQRGAAVAGRVVDTTGSGIEGVWISPLTHDGSGRGEYIGDHAVSDAHGDWVVEHMPPGEIQLEFYRSGYRRKLVSPVVVGTRDLEVTMARTAKLAGRVVDDATGEPVRKFRIRLGPASGMSASWSRQGIAFEHENGEWTSKSEQLEPGSKHSVEVWAAGYGRARKSGVVASFEPNPEACVIRLARGARITGMVLAKRDGTAVASAHVTASFKDDPYRPGSVRNAHGRVDAVTDASGAFVLRDVPAGEVTLVVEHPDHPETSDGPFQVVSGARVEKLIQLESGVRIRGRLLDEGGNAIAGATVMLTRAGQPNRDTKHTNTNATGDFEYAAVRSGDWLLRASQRDEAGVTRVASSRVDLEATTQELRVRPGPAVRIAVHAGSKRPMIVVRATGAASTGIQWYFQAATGKNGPSLVEVLGLTKGAWEAAIYSGRRKTEIAVPFTVPRTDATELVLDSR